MKIISERKTNNEKGDEVDINLNPLLDIHKTLNELGVNISWLALVKIVTDISEGVIYEDSKYEHLHFMRWTNVADKN